MGIGWLAKKKLEHAALMVSSLLIESETRAPKREEMMELLPLNMNRSTVTIHGSYFSTERKLQDQQIMYIT